MSRLLVVTAAITLALMPLGTAAVAEDDAFVSIWDPYTPGPGEVHDGFEPDDVIVGHGSVVTWEWMQGTHRVRDRVSGLGIINSGPPTSAGDTHTESFQAAATYRYICTIHDTMEGQVQVPIDWRHTVDERSFVRWSTERAPDGYTFDVQIWEPGATSWTLWHERVTRFESEHVPAAGDGLYKFRSRVRRTGVGVTAWSPVRKIAYYSK